MLLIVTEAVAELLGDPVLHNFFSL